MCAEAVSGSKRTGEDSTTVVAGVLDRGIVEFDRVKDISGLCRVPDLDLGLGLCPCPFFVLVDNRVRGNRGVVVSEAVAGRFVGWG